MYKFTQKNLDEYELEINSEIIPFKITVGLAKEIQSIDKDARLKFFQYLNEKNVSKKDLIKETINEDGSIVVDDSNYRELEQQFIQDEQINAVDRLYRNLFNLGLADLIEKLGTDKPELLTKFGQDLRQIIIGAEETPRNK